MLLIAEITLSNEEDAEAFADFMRDEYIPAVHKGPTRAGQVGGLELLRSRGETDHTFLWLVRWGGLPPGPEFNPSVDDEAVREKFEAFGASMTPRVAWSEVAAWPE